MVMRRGNEAPPEKGQETMATRVESAVQAEVAQTIREMGHNFNMEVMKATLGLFTPLQERAPKDGVETHREIAYGPHERHQLDLFTPSSRPAMPAPVVVYVHGGGFVAGARSPAPGLIYDNVPTFFARNGLIGVNMTYRLAPDHKWPSGAADVGAALGWLRDNVGEYGGDPERIYLMGQSAGATHVAAYSFISEVHGAGGPANAGAILLSGSYAPLHPDYRIADPGANQIAYYGEDLDKWDTMSPLYHVRPGHPRVFIAVTEFDHYPLAWPSAALLAEMVRCDKVLPPFRLLRDHNHVSPAMHINSEIDTLGPDLLRFVTEG